MQISVQVEIVFCDNNDNCTSLLSLPVVPCLMWLISHQVKITHLLTLVTRFETIVVDSKQCQGFHKVYVVGQMEDTFRTFRKCDLRQLLYFS